MSTDEACVTSESHQFVKYQGLGNDFILVNNTASSELKYSSQQAVILCARNFGIGADGLIFALPGQHGCDYTMRIYNSDGSEPQMCGNGIRCLAKFLHRLNMKDTTEVGSYRIWTNAGVIVASIQGSGLVEVDMGEPILEPARIPTILKSNTAVSQIVGKYPTGAVVDAEVQILLHGSAEPHVVKSTAVGMGNPHSVTFVDSLDTMVPSFDEIGPLMQSCIRAYPEKVNAEFVQVVTRNHVLMKVWERGAGPTLACGTGACAVVVAGVLSGRTERQCTVTLPGGDLHIHWNIADNKIYMTGPAVAVCSGIIELDL